MRHFKNVAAIQPLALILYGFKTRSYNDLPQRKRPNQFTALKWRSHQQKFVDGILVSITNMVILYLVMLIKDNYHIWYSFDLFEFIQLLFKEYPATLSISGFNRKCSINVLDAICAVDLMRSASRNWRMDDHMVLLADRCRRFGE